MPGLSNSTQCLQAFIHYAFKTSAIWIRIPSSVVTMGYTHFPRYISLGVPTLGNLSLSWAAALKTRKPLPNTSPILSSGFLFLHKFLCKLGPLRWEGGLVQCRMPGFSLVVLIPSTVTAALMAAFLFLRNLDLFQICFKRENV